MLIICNKRKIEPFFYKRKCVNYNVENNFYVKKHRILTPERKRKLLAENKPGNSLKKQRILHNQNKRKLLVDNKSNKRQNIEQDITKCLIHEEEYICDIYNCSGVKDIKNNYEHIPYII